MEYAIETLEIELYKIKGIQRDIRRNEHIMMSNLPGAENEQKKKEELEKAIEILKDNQ